MEEKKRMYKGYENLSKGKKSFYTHDGKDEEYVILTPFTYISKDEPTFPP